jgi:hypothetical protein
MLMRSVRLGDDIDDFCVKCKRVMNHSVVSILNDGPAKVRCRTCHSDHDFRNEQPPPPKVDSRKAALFNEVLGNVSATAGDLAVDGKPADDVKAADSKPVDAKVKAASASDIAEAEAPPAPKTKSASKAKAATKTAGKKSKA